MTNGDDAHARPTNASIDARVQRLESRIDDMQRTQDRLELNLAHTTELQKARFDTLDANVTTIVASLSSITSRFDAASMEGAKMMGDPESTPAGKAVMRAIDELRQGREQGIEAVAAIRARLAYVSGALAVIIVVANILGPAIARSIGLPH